MIWSRGFSARFTASVVDPVTWRDIKDIRITGGSIERNTEKMMESADINMTELIGTGEAWIRIWLDARQDAGASAHIPLFTGITSVPERSLDGTRESYSAECYSVLKPMADRLLQRGWYAPADADGAALAARLLSTGPAPVTFDEGSPHLADAIVAEDGESDLTMAEKIITAIGWRIKISGDGRIHICEKASEVTAAFDSLSNDIIEMHVTDTCDWYSCPNVCRAVSGYATAVARDDDPESSLSTIKRGREVWMEETDCSLNLGETLSAYALRRLKEEQSPSRTLHYDRRYQPDVSPGDLIRMRYPGNGLDGTFRIKSQSMELGYGVKTTEEAVTA